MDIYKEFDSKARRLFELADPQGFRVWKLLDMDEIPNWSRNHTVLLGDACHPLSPFGFSGASMAIEDGLTLSTLLLGITKLEELSSLLKLYENIRKPRIGRVRDTARDIARGKERETPEFMKTYKEFLENHDVVEYAKEEFAKYLATTK